MHNLVTSMEDLNLWWEASTLSAELMLLFFLRMTSGLRGCAGREGNPRGGDEERRQFNVMLEANESMRHFDEKELKLIEPLRAYRYIHFSS